MADTVIELPQLEIQTVKITVVGDSPLIMHKRKVQQLSGACPKTTLFAKALFALRRPAKPIAAAPAVCAGP